MVMIWTLIYLGPAENGIKACGDGFEIFSSENLSGS